MGGDLLLGVGPGLWVSRSVCAPGSLSRPLCLLGAGAWDCFLVQLGPWVSSLGSGDVSVSVCVHLPAVSCCYQGCVCTAMGGRQAPSLPPEVTPATARGCRAHPKPWDLGSPPALALPQPGPERLLMERAPGSHWGGTGN